MEKKLYELKIDPELESTARALRSNERDMLSEDIQARGCIAPLIVWEGIIVDGHNRYHICHEHNIPFGIEEVTFESKTDARIWIITNQLSRRNLSPFEKCELAFSMEKDLNKLAEQRRREAISRSRQTGEKLPPSQKTRDVLAMITGVSPRTIDKIRVIVHDADEQTKESLRTGKIKISSVYDSLTRKEKPGGGNVGKNKASEKKPVSKDPKVENKEETHPDDTAAHLEEPLPFNPVQSNPIPEKIVEEFDEDPEVDNRPDVIAAHLEEPLPFNPVQRDPTPDEIVEEFDEFFSDCLEDAEDIMAKLTDRKAEAIHRIREGLDKFYAAFIARLED